MKKVFVICTVRNATEKYRKNLESYVKSLEDNGYEVYLPHRDTNQNATGLEINKQKFNAIKKADEVHVFYNSKSQDTHFDLGVSFALNKKIVIVKNEKYGEGKSYARFLNEWVNNDKSEKLNQLKKELEKVKNENASIWESNGSELAAGELFNKELKLENKIAELEKN